MEPKLIIYFVLAAIFVLLIIGVSKKTFQFLIRFTIRTLVGLTLLFVFNIVGTKIDLHVPINEYSTLLVTLLGLPGVATAIILQKII